MYAVLIKICHQRTVLVRIISVFNSLYSLKQYLLLPPPPPPSPYSLLPPLLLHCTHSLLPKFVHILICTSGCMYILGHLCGGQGTTSVASRSTFPTSLMVTRSLLFISAYSKQAYPWIYDSTPISVSHLLVGVHSDYRHVHYCVWILCEFWGSKVKSSDLCGIPPDSQLFCYSINRFLFCFVF